MPVVICDSENQLSSLLPSDLSELRIADLYVNINTDGRYIQGHVKWAGQLQRTKSRSFMKIIIKQDNVHLPVFLVEKLAEDVQMITIGDRLICSSVVIESNPRPTDVQSSCQMVVDPSLSNPNIWVLHQPRQKAVASSSFATASTSNASGVKQANQSAVAHRTYLYTYLDQIKVGQTVNVFGVVKYLKSRTKTRGLDYSLFVSIMDDSCPMKLKCMIFARSEQMLPPIEKPGEIVRFHRLKISEFNGELQGQGNISHGFSCVVFSGEVNSPLTPKSVSSTYTFTDSDLNRVNELREFLSESEELSQVATSANQVSSVSRIAFKDCFIGQFFDLTCQVVGICPLNEKSLLLKVWDGTCPLFVTKHEDLSDSEYLNSLCIDEALNSEAGSFVIDVYVFDEYVDRAARLRPLDYIKLKNLHAAVYPRNNPTTSCDMPPVEFIIHGSGASFGRDIVLLHETDPEVIDLKRQLTAVECCDLEPLDTNSVTELEAANCPEQRHGGYCDPPLDLISSFNSENRCMLNTATVLTANHCQQTSTIKEVLQKQVPHKFHLFCHIRDFLPKADRPEELVKLYCKKCNYMASLPVVYSNNPTSTTLAPTFYKKGRELSLYSCPRCKGAASDRCLEYTMMLQFLLYDNTGWIVAGLWRDEAVKFFHDISIAAVLLEDQSFEYVKTRLAGLINDESSFGSQRGTDQSPLIECCVKSYVAKGGVCYQMIDTCLTRSNSDS